MINQNIYKGKRIHSTASEEEMILNPNCSETVFRLVGDFDDIKKQVFKLIDWVEMEYDGRTGDGPRQKLDTEMIQQFKDLRNNVKMTQSLKDIEKIMIGFTCNYETFFKEHNGDLLVATCNNYNYDNLDKCDPEDDVGYYEVAGKTTYDVLEKYEGSWILRLRYDDEDHDIYPLFIITAKDVVLYSFEDLKQIKIGDDISLISRENGVFQNHGNKLEVVPLLDDEEKVNKIKLVLSLQMKRRSHEKQ